jgi:hypothetical protein
MGSNFNARRVGQPVINVTRSLDSRPWIKRTKNGLNKSSQRRMTLKSINYVPQVLAVFAREKNSQCELSKRVKGEQGMKPVIYFRKGSSSTHSLFSLRRLVFARRRGINIIYGWKLCWGKGATVCLFVVCCWWVLCCWMRRARGEIQIQFCSKEKNAAERESDHGEV